MITDPTSTMTWYYPDNSCQEVHSVLRTPHYSSAVARFQDDGFGNPEDTDLLPDSVNTQALNFILEDLH